MTILQDMARSGCGCDDQQGAKTLISIDRALALIVDRATPVSETENLPLGQALGRILAYPVHARSACPSFDNAAMDGYAVCTREMTGDGPWTLDVVARVPAGQPGDLSLTGLQAARIFTGAPIPTGADAVVMQENVCRTGSAIHIARRPAPGLNIRRTGSEMAAGTLVLGRGRRIGPREIAACAAAGAGSVTVQRCLRLALLVTGDEVRSVGKTRDEAQIWDVNTPMLTAALTQPGLELVAVEQGLDSRDGLYLQIAELAASADLVITTGGISVGEEDHVKPAIQNLGGVIHFSGVAIKPGKPVSFGTVRGVSWLGLPGNPLSAFVTWQLFGTALVARLAGNTGPGTARRHVVSATAISRKPGRCELRPATRAGFDGQGREVVTFQPETHSSQVRALPDADGLILIPAENEFLPEGALVEFLPFCRT